MTPASPLINIADLDYAPEGQPVLAGINFRSDKMRIGIVGRNGSGKTSLARLMAGLVPANRGHVTIAGIDVARDRRGALRTVGINFQNPDHQIIFPTVEEEIAFGLMQQGQGKAEAQRGVEAMLARFGKSHWKSRAIHRLSQGQRQLVCLMSILAMKPRLIILDEPFAGLDIPTAAHLTRILAGLEEALVQITHDPRSLVGYDEVLWLEQGALVKAGAAHEVLASYRARMTELEGRDDLSDLAG